MTVCFSSMAAWERPKTCVGSARPGARAMLAYFLESTLQTRSMGIYNCRKVGGTSSLSVHAEGRAVDLGLIVIETGYAFLEVLAPYAKRLGVCYAIFDRTKWADHRDDCGEYYGGVSPHRDHIHLELNRAAGEGLTLATLRAVAGDYRDSPLGVDGGMNMLCKKGDNGAHVKAWQERLLIDDSGSLPSFGADSDFGGETEAATRSWQSVNGIATTGALDPLTFAVSMSTAAGEAGPRGPQGPEGSKGDQGSKGSQGSQGLRGSQGLKGDDGKGLESGTEIKMSTDFTVL